MKIVSLASRGGLMWIRANDTVEVITGEDRGHAGPRCCASTARPGSWWSRASTACTSTSAAARRTRRAAGSPRRCRSRCPTCCWSARRASAATRVGARFLADGGKERYCKKCGAGNGQIAPPKAAPRARSSHERRTEQHPAPEEQADQATPPSRSRRSGKRARSRPRARRNPRPKRPTSAEGREAAKGEKQPKGDKAAKGEKGARPRAKKARSRPRARRAKKPPNRQADSHAPAAGAVPEGDPAGAGRAVGPDQPARRCRGWRRSWSTWAWARRSPRRNTWKRPSTP